MSFIVFLIIMLLIFIIIGFLLKSKFKEEKKLGKLRIIKDVRIKDRPKFIVEQYSIFSYSRIEYDRPTWQLRGVFYSYFKAKDCLFDLKETYEKDFKERNTREVIYESD